MTVTETNERITREYFELIKDLRAGKKEAVAKLVDLWDPDGTFEFAGAPPVNATFHGRNAIHVMYSNRLAANGMAVTLEGDARARAAEHQRTALGVVETDVRRTRAINGGDRIVAGWVTRMGAEDGRGFEVHGSHSFTFKNGKISTLKVVVSPKADAAANLRLEGLAVDDIGRLALAAWCVV